MTNQEYREYMDETITQDEFDISNKIDNDEIPISEVDFKVYQVEI